MTETVFVCQDCKVQYTYEQLPEDGQCEDCYGYELREVFD